MRRPRVTVTVPPEALEAATRDVEAGKADSVSAWVSDAMAQKARRESLKDLLAEIRAEIGPATKEETEWARAVLGL
jgi:hypothetical protein